MSIDCVLDTLHEWIDSLLNIEAGLNVPVVFGNENAPRPPLPYVIIHDPPISNVPMGRGNWGTSDASGNVDYTIHYEIVISIEEVGGRGDYLRQLINSINRQDTKDFFTSENVSILRVEAINEVTENNENRIIRRSVMDLAITYSDENTYNTSYIGSVETNGTYE